jgi:hypothetical protein
MDKTILKQCNGELKRCWKVLFVAFRLQGRTRGTEIDTPMADA